jgi:hypothetical protein
METFLLRLADYGFLIFHAGLTLFNLLGWVRRETRPANLVTLLLTAGSWFILGIWYGIGYCPFTDWHWEVLYRLGRTDLPRSYITYLIQRIIGLQVPGPLVERWTVILFFLALLLSVSLSIRDRRPSR